MNGSVIIVSAKTIEEVRGVVNSDPYCVGGVVRTSYSTAESENHCYSRRSIVGYREARHQPHHTPRLVGKAAHAFRWYTRHSKRGWVPQLMRLAPPHDSYLDCLGMQGQNCCLRQLVVLDHIILKILYKVAISSLATLLQCSLTGLDLSPPAFWT